MDLDFQPYNPQSGFSEGYKERGRSLSAEDQEMIFGIERDIEAINRLSVDMNGLVHEQGEAISLIGDNVESSKLRSSIAEKDLVQASEYQSSSRYGTLALIIVTMTAINVPLGLAFGAKVGLIGVGCCAGVGVTKVAYDSIPEKNIPPEN